MEAAQCPGPGLATAECQLQGKLAVSLQKCRAVAGLGGAVAGLGGYRICIYIYIWGYFPDSGLAAWLAAILSRM